MYLLIVILEKSYDLDLLIDKYRQIGITGATIIDSSGIGNSMLHQSDLPVIANIRQLFEAGNLSNSHTLLSVVPDEQVLDNAMKEISEIVGGFNKPDTGIMFSIKLERVEGSHFSSSEN
jgi:nitrogen regulatory protein P-II 1